MRRVRFFLRQLLFDLVSGLLLRPALITLLLALLAVTLTTLEARSSEVQAGATATRWLFHGEPSSAQAVLAAIAGSMMAVLSIVYSVLIMALSLMSMQFSPRTLGNLMRDPVSQSTFGMFIGTFVFCLLVLGEIDSRAGGVPRVATSMAVLLALASLAQLIYFIHRTANAMQANHLIERIAQETLRVIDEVLPQLADEADPDPAEEAPPPAASQRVAVRAAAAGYVQLIDEEGLTAVAAATGSVIHTERAPGEFVVRGGVIASLSGGKVDDGARSAILSAFDLGSVRTLQQDYEYGIRQIVDVALKAISPAVNDPSTAVTCIDHLGNLVAHLARRRFESSVVTDERGKPRLVRRRATFQHTLDLAFNQLRQYSRTDLSVSIRLMRALGEIAQATENPSHRIGVSRQARLLRAGLSGFAAEEREPLDDLGRAVDAACSPA